MTNPTIYGVISEVHRDPRIVPEAIEVLKSLGAQKLLLNGDIGESHDTMKASQDHIAYVLDSAGKSDLETYVQPGSHETVGSYAPVMDHFSNQYSNLTDAVKNPIAEINGHNLVFLPGSDWNARGGEYTIGDRAIPTGTYVKTSQRLIPLPEDGELAIPQGTQIQGFLHYQNMDDLKKRVTDPDKTIVVCHVPRKFDNIDESVDMAYFAEQANGSLMPGIVLENMIRKQVGNIPYDQIKQIAVQNGYTFKRENRGNKGLKDLYEGLGIKKAVSGHFHESVHRANDRNGTHVQEDTPVDKLFWNASYADERKVGILVVEDGKVKYHNIEF
ncbi:MAG: hypothetical protein AABX29_08110 [Nanoarchaeota archaeon]